MTITIIDMHLLVLDGLVELSLEYNIVLIHAAGDIDHPGLLKV